MHQNWTMYVTWSLYSLWHNSELLLFSKLSLRKTTLLGGGQLRSAAVEALGHRHSQHSPVFWRGFPAGKAVMEKLTLNIPKILEYSPKRLPKTAPVNFKTIQQPSPSEKISVWFREGEAKSSTLLAEQKMRNCSHPSLTWREHDKTALSNCTVFCVTTARPGFKSSRQ